MLSRFDLETPGSAIPARRPAHFSDLTGASFREADLYGADLKQAFRDSINDYLAFCEERGEAPDKPFSGRLMVRLEPGLHRDVYVRAKREGKSLDQWIAERLADFS